MTEFMKYETDIPNYMDSIISQQQRELITKQDNLIKDALIRNGVNITDIEFIKNNMTRIIKEGDKFEHYFLHYGTDKQVRILSMQKTPDITNNYSDNKYTITANCKYY